MALQPRAHTLPKTILITISKAAAHNRKEVEMTGRQGDVAVEGSQNESLAAYLLGHLCAPVKVPREHDFGIDYFCQLYAPGGRRSVDSRDLFAVQVKGGNDSVVHYGGVRENQWRSYEIAWLRSVMIPLFVARTDMSAGTISLHSMGPVWRVLWQTEQPFEINCVPGRASTEDVDIEEITREISSEAYGDKTIWTVPLGPPLLYFSNTELTNPDFAPNAQYVLKRQIEFERRNLLNFFQGVALHECLGRWRTNDFTSQARYHRAMFWDRTQGKNISLLASAVAPGLVNLGVHLQWQDNPDAYRLIAILEWLWEKGALDMFGIGLLTQLKDRQAQNLSPSSETDNRVAPRND